jgi:drug/metabolite transporter (DMT)-like permease
MSLFDLHKKTTQIFLLLFLSFIWGASFILIKRGLESYTDVQVSMIRIFSASVFLLPFIFKKIKRLKKRHIFSLCITGFLGNLIPAYLFAKAQTEVSSSVAGMLNAGFPVMALIIGGLFYKDRPGKYEIVGIIIGLIGAFGIIFFDEPKLGHSVNYYAFYIVLAVIMYGFSINTVKHKLKDLDGFSIAVLTFTFIAPFAGISLIFSDFPRIYPNSDGMTNLAYIIILGIGSSAVAVSLFYLLIEYTNVAFSSLTTYISPIFAILWGISDGETISVLQIISMVIILAGVFLVNKKSKNTKIKTLQ